MGKSIGNHGITDNNGTGDIFQILKRLSSRYKICNHFQLPTSPGSGLGTWTRDRDRIWKTYSTSANLIGHNDFGTIKILGGHKRGQDE